VAEEPPLAPEASAVTGQRGVPADEPVAGDDDGYRIATVRGPDRTRGGAEPEGVGEVSVAPGATGPDPTQCLPDPPLERRATGIHRDPVHHREVAGQIGADLRAEAGGVPGPDRSLAAEAGGQRAEHTGPSELEGTQAPVSYCDHDAPDRARDLVDENWGGGSRAHVIFDPDGM
jgi:hypothetical protein